MKFTTAFLKKLKADYYNQYGMISPEGKIYLVENGHADWANLNYKNFNIDFHPTMTWDKKHTDNVNELLLDKDNKNALDKFFEAGWIRVVPKNGVQMSGLHSIHLVTKILTDMAAENPGAVLYIDTEDKIINVPVNFRGRPDFSKLQEVA